MKYVKQFGIILAISFLGELLHAVIPLPVPGSIYGLLLMFAALATKVLSLEKIAETADFLLEIMPMLFIPSAVGLIAHRGLLRELWLPILVILIVTTFVTMAASAGTTTLVLHWEKKRK